MFTLRENMLFSAQWTRSFELESVLYQFQFQLKPERRRVLPFRGNVLFFAQRTRRFELEFVLH
jgi:hypothetical protein